MGNYRHLFWDLDGTILDFKKCEIDALHRTFSRYRIPFSDEILQEYMLINNQLWKMHDNGQIEQDQVLVERFDILFNLISINCSAKDVSKDYQRSLTESVYFEKHALEVIRELYGTCDMYITTNGNTVTQTKRIELAGIKQYFKGIFISGEIGIHKPNSAYFDYCFEHIPGIDKNHTLIIGDSISSDMKGGKNARIHTCWYNPSKMTLPTGMTVDYEIIDLQELLTKNIC